MNLTEFLLARVAEDDEAARSRDLSLPIHFIGCYYYDHTLDANLFCDCDEDAAASARLLAECDAKRRMVERATEAREASERIREMFDGATDARAKVERASYDAASRAWHDALLLIAIPYADHPDYRAEWAV